MPTSALQHTQHLAQTIGPRGSTTPKEKEGHAYVQQFLEGLGLEARQESFQAPTSTYTPFILGLGMVLVAEAIYWLIAASPNEAAGALAAAVLTGVCLVSMLLELSTMDNPLRWFIPLEKSQNVIGVIPAAGEARRRVAILAHVDTHRTPFIWHSRTTFGLYRLISTLGVVSVAALLVMFGLAAFAVAPGLRHFTLIPGAVALAALAMVTQAHFTPYTEGANDNASGVGVMLALAEQLRAQPLPNTEVWCVATGCEEVGAYGSADFIRRHGAQFKDGAVITIDNVAAKDTGPVYLRSETLFLPNRYPAGMLALAERLAAEHPELGARPMDQVGAYTDGIHAMHAGLPALTFVGYTRDGWIPNWHHPGDTFDKVDEDALERTVKFVTEVLLSL